MSFFLVNKLVCSSPLFQQPKQQTVHRNHREPKTRLINLDAPPFCLESAMQNPGTLKISFWCSHMPHIRLASQFEARSQLTGYENPVQWEEDLDWSSD